MCVGRQCCLCVVHNVGVFARSHDTWQKPTPSAVRLAGRLLNALNKVVFCDVQGDVARRRMSLHGTQFCKYHENRPNFLDSNRREWLRNTTAVYQRRTL